MTCRYRLVLLGLLAIVVVQTSLARLMAEEKAAGKMLAHNVYFVLNEKTEAAKAKLIAACKQHLTNHPGTVFFGVGTVSDLDRPVNDRDWDVGLHLVFENMAAHDRYQTSSRHDKFVAENKTTWSKVRVFDADIEGK